MTVKLSIFKRQSHHFISTSLQYCQSNGTRFALIMWLLSRSVILIALLGIAPFYPVPPGTDGIQAEWGWGVFSAWDSELYQGIVNFGYEVKNNGEAGGNVAFFPLFPLLIKLLMNLGFSFETAGVLINNLAFLGTLILAYNWIEKTNNPQVARWVTAVLAWCPLSLFGTVIYTEGLFLLFSTAALKAFDLKRYPQVVLWGTLATATRITGLALIPAFLLTAWRQKRSIIAYLSGLLTALGVLFYSIYCWINFNNPIAFITVQHSQWQRQTGFDWQGWLKMFMQIMIGSQNWKKGMIIDFIHPLIWIMICIAAYLLWRYKNKLNQVQLELSYFVLFLILWLLAGDPLLNTGVILGGGYLLWRFRKDLSLVAVLYGFSALGLLLASGGTISLIRLAYGIVSISLGLGFLFPRYRYLGYATLVFFTYLLISFSVRFAQHLWVA